MVERIAYMGKFSADATNLQMEEYLKLMNSRERRSVKRNPITYKKLIEKVEKYKKKNITKAVRTHVREAVIVPAWIGMKFQVYNGKEFKEFQVSANMLGHRLGEYSYTTKRVLHSQPGIRATRGSKFLAVK